MISHHCSPYLAVLAHLAFPFLGFSSIFWNEEFLAVLHLIAIRFQIL
jgi:hypothetical protein